MIETDTLDTFFDSSWYFLRFLDPENSKELVSRSRASREMPVSVYVGGMEHASMHLFYARFISYFLYDLGVMPQPEPFERFIPQGYVNGKTFVLAKTGAFLRSNGVEEKGSNFCDNFRIF